MQVSLDAVDWTKLTSFATAGEFLEWIFDLEDEDQFPTLTCYDHGWFSDSAIQYFEVAGVLDHLASVCDAETSEHLRGGIQRLIAESGHVDEFSLSEPSEGCYWISAGPETVESLKHHIDRLDLAQCIAVLKKHPAPDAEETMADLDDGFVRFIKQHADMVDLAASRGYGLLGHCG